LVFMNCLHLSFTDSRRAREETLNLVAIVGGR